MPERIRLLPRSTLSTTSSQSALPTVSIERLCSPSTDCVRVTLAPTSADDNPCPSLEFAYTDRYQSTDAVGQTVANAGCDCEGACDPTAASTCSCLLLQSRLNGSKAAGFAYDGDGLLRTDLAQEDIPIVECSAACACGPACTNKVSSRHGRAARQSLTLLWPTSVFFLFSRSRRRVGGWTCSCSRPKPGDGVSPRTRSFCPIGDRTCPDPTERVP